MDVPVFPVQYFGNLHYYHEISKYPDIYIESNEYYIKQTFRNRTYILTANGIMPLIVPVVHRSSKEIISEKNISYTERWYKKHYTAILSAYKNAPYFEYYADDLLEHLIHHNEQTLFEMNLNILKKVLRIIGIHIKIRFTNQYHAQYQRDYRHYFENTKDIPQVLKKPYIQVFSDRFVFHENLSILDVIFNLGPLAKSYIEGNFNM